MASLFELVLESAPPALRAKLLDEASTMAARLEELVARASRQWPAMSVSTPLLASMIARHLARGSDGDLAPMMEELYLACACAAGDGQAIAELERRCFSVIDPALSAMKVGALSDEVKQLLRTRLFVAPPHGPPRIVEYAGRGNLRVLVRVAAIRAALNFLRDAAPRAGDRKYEEVADLLVREDNPELALIWKDSKDAFKQALEGAVSVLQPRERTLLRLQLLDGLSIDQVARIFGVHRATAARWLVKARRRVSDEVQRRLSEKLRVSPDEIEAIARAFERRLDLSLSRILRSMSSEPPP